MSGGTWSPTDMPVLPGMFMNFQAAASSAIQSGARGVVIVPVKAHWGPVRQFVEISNEAAIKEHFSVDESNGATAFTTLFLSLLGRPKTLLAYRIADASAAEATTTIPGTDGTEMVKLTAKYPGERANQFSVTIKPSLVDANAKEIKLYEGTALLRTIHIHDGSAEAAVEAINGDTINGQGWITAEKIADGVLGDVSGSMFAGGNSGISGLTNADYIAALSAFEGQDFNVLTLDGITDAALRASLVAWVKRVRGEGKGIIAVLGGSKTDDTASDAVSKTVARGASMDFEGIVNVGTGGVLAGKEYSSAQTAAYVAGLIAGQRLNESTTYAASPFDDVTRRWTRAEQEQAVKNGVFLLIHDGRKVKALRGINSLVTLRDGQNNAWKKIRTIRVMDAINDDLQRTAEDVYIGKLNNTEEGQIALIGACKEYLRVLSQSGVIKSTGYNVILDPKYYGSAPAKKPEPDQVFLQWNAELTDVMEQIFGTFYVQ
ncbi:phage tail sheath family protein [Paenibacillus sp. MSJ-34]|uniref:phage tail sheath family protein n=1 Tax=Paenibacillus sp. MSJ-34 TaxID=2841529 RepID=UPI001C105D5E|nr:phage tail sheath family protein [Paenibacillus sp. MSJ-34]MBU5441209.1 phage tail sheath family protein [Paenibacillus sp. MSJ-34]